MSFEIVIMALESLWSNKTRTILSMLGIIIGVLTVIVVVGIGKGSEQSVNEQFQGLSANSLIIMSNNSRESTGSSKLNAEDLKTIKEESTHIGEATAAVSGKVTVSFGKESSNVSILGVDYNYFDVSNYEIKSGEAINEINANTKSKIVVLGTNIADDLFVDEDPIGKTLTIKGKTYNVIGVLNEIGSSFGPITPDDSIFIPYKTAETSVLGGGGRVMLNLSVDNINNVALASKEVDSILREKHRLKSSQEDDFRIIDAGSMVGAAQETAALMTKLLTVIAAITLLVSGIGIMNVMFVTVAERTKEIGIAKAIGGKQSDILSQFLLESIVLSTIAGIIGIVLGIIAIYIINKFNFIFTVNTIIGPLMGFSFSVIVGVSFGFYPAYKASRLDPVDALRSE